LRQKVWLLAISLTEAVGTSFGTLRIAASIEKFAGLPFAVWGPSGVVAETCA
jgi:hypothetical protein